MYMVDTLPNNNSPLGALYNILHNLPTTTLQPTQPQQNCHQNEYNAYVLLLQSLHTQCVYNRGLIYNTHMIVCNTPIVRDIWGILLQYLIGIEQTEQTGLTGGTGLTGQTGPVGHMGQFSTYITIHNEIIDYLQDIYCRYVLHCYDGITNTNTGNSAASASGNNHDNGNNNVTPHSDWPRKVCGDCVYVCVCIYVCSV